ncbi:MAG: DUF952 domain-containing protein [Planctomycetes bacterium]|nr:DUF952 domain-containing protein [Planctomycetota bacterium]
MGGARVTTRLALGISTCPNDTFAFHGLLTGAVETPGLALDVTLADVEELNLALARGALDVAKVSFARALELGAEVRVLRAGAALGFGNGPLLLAREPRADLAGARVLAPGAGTTAYLLYRLFHPAAPAPEQVVFSDILPALEAGRADVGVCIHEGRFTYAARGLVKLEDLGETWERRTASPLPLGGIVARRALGDDVTAALELAIGRSIDHARAHPDDARATMRRYAQEASDAVLDQHVELYVNASTRRLGDAGRAALAALSREARRAGLLAPEAADLEVFAPPRLFHLAPAAAWRARAAGAPWRPPSLAAEGFVHLSFASQLAGTLAAHFDPRDELWLLELDPARVEAELRYEPSRAGALFPHVYRALEETDALAHWPVRGGAVPDLARPAGAGAPPR